MPSLKEMLARAEADQAKAAAGEVVLRPYVTPLHNQWLEVNDPPFTREAVARGAAVLANAHKVKRTERFSASGLGHCPRRQVFSYAGAPQTPPSTQSMNIMRAGTAAHFWIMLEGLSMGWLVEAEVFWMDDHWRVGGTLDGMMDDGSIWEYKNVAMSVFKRVAGAQISTWADNDPMTKNGPKPEHVLQTTAYELLTGSEVKSLFYEERNYGDFYEYRLGHDEDSMKQLLKLLDRLNSYVDDNELPPMLADCERGTGNVFNDCPYRKHCPSATRPFT